MQSDSVLPAAAGDGCWLLVEPQGHSLAATLPYYSCGAVLKSYTNNHFVDTV